MLRTSAQTGRLLGCARRAALALAACAGLAAQEWSGVITVEESMVGPANVGGSDRAELDDYARSIKERLQKTQQEMRTVPPVIAQVMREDIGAYQAELERVVLESGEAVKVATSVFSIRGERMLVSGDGPRLLVDRAANQEASFLGGKRETETLAPLPTLVEIDKAAPEVVVNGVTTRRLSLRAEGRTCTVLLAPGLPNPYALGLLPAAAGEKDTIAAALAALPGLPMLVEYKSEEVTHRWAVVKLEAKPIPDAAFSE